MVYSLVPDDLYGHARTWHLLQNLRLVRFIVRQLGYGKRCFSDIQWTSRVIVRELSCEKNALKKTTCRRLVQVIVRQLDHGKQRFCCCRFHNWTMENCDFFFQSSVDLLTESSSDGWNGMENGVLPNHREETS